MTTRRGEAATLAGLLATAALFAALLPANMRMAADWRHRGPARP